MMMRVTTMRRLRITLGCPGRGRGPQGWGHGRRASEGSGSRAGSGSRRGPGRPTAIAPGEPRRALPGSVIASLVLALVSCSPLPPCPPAPLVRVRIGACAGAGATGAATTGRGAVAATTGGGGAAGGGGSRSWRLLGGLRLPVDANGAFDHLRTHLDRRRRGSSRITVIGVQRKAGQATERDQRYGCGKLQSQIVVVWFTLDSLIRWSLLRQSCSADSQARDKSG